MSQLLHVCEKKDSRLVEKHNAKTSLPQKLELTVERKERKALHGDHRNEVNELFCEEVRPPTVGEEVVER